MENEKRKTVFSGIQPSGNLTIGRLSTGQFRKLSPAEVEYLKRI